MLGKSFKTINTCSLRVKLKIAGVIVNCQSVIVNILA